MKRYFQILFLLLISFIAFSQEKKEKISLSASGGINISNLTNPNKGGIGYSYESDKAQSNEFYGLECILSLKKHYKISLGGYYHHFSYYILRFTDFTGTNLKIYDFKMLLAAPHFLILTNVFIITSILISCNS